MIRPSVNAVLLSPVLSSRWRSVKLCQSMSHSKPVQIRHLERSFPWMSRPAIVPLRVQTQHQEAVFVHFVPHENITAGTISLYAIKWALRMPLPLPNPDVCHGYGRRCPLKACVPVTLSSTLSFASSCNRSERSHRDLWNIQLECRVETKTQEHTDGNSRWYQMFVYILTNNPNISFPLLMLSFLR